MSAHIGDDEPVNALRNLGTVSVQVLKEIDVNTVGDLRVLGAADAYHRLKFMDPKRVNLNFLYALNAGLEDIPWPNISVEMKIRWRRAAGLEE